MSFVKLISHPKLEWQLSLPGDFRRFQLPGSEIFTAIGDCGYFCVQQYTAPDYIIRLYFSQLTEVFIFQAPANGSGLQSFLMLDGVCEWQPFPGYSTLIKTKHFALQGSNGEASGFCFPKGNAALFEIHFKELMITEMAGSFPDNDEKLIHHPEIFLQLPTIASEEVLSVVHAINHCAYNAELRSLFFSGKVRDVLFYYLLAATGNDVIAQDELSPYEKNLVLQAEQMIKADLSRHVPIIEIAKKLMISKRSFERLFKMAKGVAPFEFLVEERMRFALAQLQAGSTIKQVAEATGYGVSTFIRAFRRFYGLPPSTLVEKNSKR